MARDFFAKFQVIRKDEIGYVHSFVQDAQTGMISMHNFPHDKSVEDYYPEFITKYKRRFANLKDAILNSKHIVFVGNRDNVLQDFQVFLDEMQKIHTVKYTFIHVKNSKRSMTKRIMMGGGWNYIIEYVFNDIYPQGSTNQNSDFWIGNVKKWNRIMRKT